MLEVLSFWTGPSAFAGVVATVWWIARLDSRVIRHDEEIRETGDLIREMNRAAHDAVQRLSRIEGRIIGLQNGYNGQNGQKK